MHEASMVVFFNCLINRRWKIIFIRMKVPRLLCTSLQLLKYLFFCKGEKRLAALSDIIGKNNFLILIDKREQ